MIDGRDNTLTFRTRAGFMVVRLEEFFPALHSDIIKLDKIYRQRYDNFDEANIDELKICIWLEDYIRKYPHDNGNKRRKANIKWLEALQIAHNKKGR